VAATEDGLFGGVRVKKQLKKMRRRKEREGGGGGGGRRGREKKNIQTKRNIVCYCSTVPLYYLFIIKSSAFQ